MKSCRHWLILPAALLVILAGMTSLAGAAAVITITDEMGRTIELSPPIERLVVLTSYPSEIICALGAGDKLAGICKPKNHFLPEIQKKPSIGMSAVDPNLEKIVELKPDLVIAYQWTKKDAVEKLERLNIPVACYGAWTLEQIHHFLDQMGLVLGKTARAEELWAFIEKTSRQVRERTQLLDTREKPAVFLEGTTPYQTTNVRQIPMKTPWGEFIFENPSQTQLTIAGGINCVGRQPVRTPRMSPEWVIEKNPDAFIKIAFSSMPGSVVSAEFMQKIRDDLMARNGWQHLKAVQNGRVFIIHPRLCAGPMQVISGCYYAKWLHPDLFPDLNPAEIHEEMLKKFWGVTLSGAWGFPYPK